MWWTRGAKLAGHLHGHLGRQPGPGGQLVAREPQADHRVGAHGVAHRAEHLTCEADPVGVVVGAVVGQPRQVLTDQAVLAGVDLHAVAAGTHRGARRGCEAVDDLADVGALHPLGDLAAVDLRHPRRRPQRCLAVRARPLPAGVAQRGQCQGSVGTDGAGDGGPTRCGLGGERGALVGPVAGVDGGLLDHDHARPAGGSALVVGDVTIGQGTTPAQVRLVWPEHDPVARR